MPETKAHSQAFAPLSLASDANIIRVHDVKEMVRVTRMTDAVAREA